MCALRVTAGAVTDPSLTPFCVLFRSTARVCGRCAAPLQAHQLALGPAGSGSPLHFHEDAVNALIYGLKAWDLLPPARTAFSIAPPWCPAAEAAGGGVAHAGCRPPPAGGVRCVQVPGDLMYVPRRWAHSTVNLADGVAIAVESDGTACWHANCSRVVV